MMSVRELVEEPEIITSPQDKLSDIIGKMREKKQWVIPVVKDKKLYGIFSYKDLLARRISLETRIGTLMSPSVSLSINDDLTRIIAKFYTSNSRAIPVVDEKKRFQGMITREGLLKYLLESGQIDPAWKVREYMSSPAITIEAEETVARARWIMTRDNITRLPVMENGKLAGIITTKDIVDKLYSFSGRKRSSILTEEERIVAMPVKEIMVYPVITVTGGISLKNAVSTLLNKGISGMPVVEGENVVGVISGIDIIKAVSKKYEISVPIEAKLTRDLRSSDTKALIDGIVERYMGKLEKLVDVMSFKVSFKEEAKSQDKKYYKVTIKVSTKLGNFVTRDSDWDPAVAVKRAIEALENRLKRYIRKVEESQKRPPKEE